MAVDVIMPQMGESIFEGTITKWLKKPGDRIERDEPLFEISTDKVDAEIPAPSAGVLKEIKVPEGQTVPIQTVVAVIDAEGASVATPAAASTPAPAPVAATAPKSKRPRQPPRRPCCPRLLLLRRLPCTCSHCRPGGPGNGKEVRSSPLVRRIAKENNVDLSEVEGSGAGGRVSKKDILAAVESGGVKPSAPARQCLCLLLPRPHLPRLYLPLRVPRDLLWCRRDRAARSCTRCLKTPSRASAFISAILKPSR